MWRRLTHDCAYRRHQNLEPERGIAQLICEALHALGKHA